MSLGAGAEPERERPLGLAIAVLTVTQLIGWGSTFHLPAILADRFAAGTQVSPTFVFGGLTLMLIASAALSPLAGRLLERYGAPPLMALGSGLTALALLILSRAEGPIAFGLAWLVFGVAMPLALAQGSSTALVQIAPERARRAIALLLLLTGVSTTVSWPTLIWLDGRFGWRTGLLILAGVQLLVCMPLHAFALPRRASGSTFRLRPSGRLGSDASSQALGGFALVALGLSLAGMLTWGLPLHMVAILKEYGHAEESAVWISGLLGPGQVLARGLEMLSGPRFGILAVGIVAGALMPIALAALLAWGESTIGAIAFSIGYGLSAGLISIVRAVLPIRVFGTRSYAVVLGRLGLPQNIGFAVAPLGFAAFRESAGGTALVVLALAIGLVAFVALVEIARRAPAEPPP